MSKLQDFELRGKFGICLYGEDDSDEKTWEKQVVIYRKPVTRPRAEQLAEQKRLLQMGVYEDEEVVEPMARAAGAFH